MRQFNERVVLHAIRLHGRLPKAEIARLTHLTPQTVQVIIARLEADRLVRRLEPVRGKVGQPSVPMALNPDGAFSIGVKIGRRSLDLLLLDFVGQVRDRNRLDYPAADPDTLFDEIGARLDPEPWNPWPCHWTTSGATLAVRRTVYKRVGGLPALPVGEDRAFVALLRSHDALVRHEPSIVVTTSGRLDGRAPGGAADTMKLRCEVRDSLCDDRLEPVLRAMRRVLWRRHLRHLHGMGRLTKHAHWASRLALSSEQAARCAGHSVFNMAFAEIEKASSCLSFKPLRPAALPLQIAMAKVVLRIVRAMDRARPAGRRSGNVPHVAGEAPAQSQPNSR